MATLAETLGIYRNLLISELVQPLQPLKPGDTATAAANVAQQIAGNASGQTSKAQQDLAAAKENVPVLPSDRTPEQQAQLDKAKAEVQALPLDDVTNEQFSRSGIYKALMEMDDEDDPHAYQRHVMASLHGWFKRHAPSAYKIIYLTGRDAPDAQDRLYRQLLYPRIVKWDFPHHFSWEYQQMIDDLVKSLVQQAP